MTYQPSAASPQKQQQALSESIVEEQSASKDNWDNSPRMPEIKSQPSRRDNPLFKSH